LKGFNGSAAVSESQQESSFVPQTFDSSDQEIIARSESYFGSDFTEIPVITTQSTPIQDENLRETENSTECGFSPVTKFYQQLSPARSRCYAGLEALNSILTLDECALYQKRFEENCGLGDALYKAWFTLKSEVMAEDSLRKSKIREICQQTNSSALARRELFKVPVKKKQNHLLKTTSNDFL